MEVVDVASREFRDQELADGSVVVDSWPDLFIENFDSTVQIGGRRA